MITFKEFLNEGRFNEMVHKNPSMEAIKRLAKENKYGSARFVVYKNGDVIVGDSEKHTHQSMAPSMGAWHHRGYVEHHEGSYFYRSMGVYDHLPQEDHPFHQRMRKAGITSGDKDEFSVNEKELTVEEIMHLIDTYKRERNMAVSPAQKQRAQEMLNKYYAELKVKQSQGGEETHEGE